MPAFAVFVLSHGASDFNRISGTPGFTSPGYNLIGHLLFSCLPLFLTSSPFHFNFFETGFVLFLSIRFLL